MNDTPEPVIFTKWLSLKYEVTKYIVAILVLSRVTDRKFKNNRRITLHPYSKQALTSFEILK